MQYDGEHSSYIVLLIAALLKVCSYDRIYNSTNSLCATPYYLVVVCDWESSCVSSVDATTGVWRFTGDNSLALTLLGSLLLADMIDVMSRRLNVSATLMILSRGKRREFRLLNVLVPSKVQTKGWTSNRVFYVTALLAMTPLLWSLKETF